MRRFLFLAACAALAACSFLSGQEAADPVLRVPEGFVASKAAAAPDVMFPMFACLDDEGRLFVAEASGLDLYKELSAQTRKCRIRVLWDRDEQGRFRKSQVFADKLVYPMGLAWRDGKLYVADPPELVTLEDTDGDGQADRRTKILGGFGHKDNGSLHGLIFGPDERLYMTMGEPDGYKITRRDGQVIESTTGALLRCRPDGADPEVVSRGFVNLVEVAFTPTGDMIGTDNWFQLPAGGIRDAFVHLVDGGLYPRHEDRGTPQPVTGEMLPAAALFPAVAVSGLERYRGRAFGMAGQLFSAQHNTRAVGRHVLVPQGSTFTAQSFDFVTSAHPDFHPADVLEDGDGSLLVLDTGAWYVQHCPTGQIRKSEATGGIYRVRKAGAAAVEDPFGSNIDWRKADDDKLIGLFADARPAVQDRARRTLLARGQAALPALTKALAGELPADSRLHALWALGGIEVDEALVPLRSELARPGPGRLVAARLLGLRRDRAAAPALVKLLAEEDAPVRRQAAESLARCGDARAVAPLWQALARTPDPFEEHALVFALHFLTTDADLEAKLKDASPREQKAALVLLDQPPRPKGKLKPDDVVARISAADPALSLAARRILQKHPEWAPFALGLLRDWLARAQLTDQERLGLRGLLLTFQGQKPVQELIGNVLAGAEAKVPLERRLLVVEAIAETTVEPLPASWKGGLERSLDDADLELRQQAVRTLAVLQLPAFDERLAKLAASPKEKPELRLEALRAIVLRRPKLDDTAFELLLGQLKEDAGPLARLTAAEILGRATLADEQLGKLLVIARVDALISPSLLLPLLRRSTTGTTAPAVLDYLTASLKAGWKPAEADLEKLLTALPAETRPQADKLRALVKESAALQRARLAQFEPLLQGGKPERGRDVFFGKKVACATCHRVGPEGGQVGPDLTKIGAVRAGRDLLESVVLPSSTIAQGFDAYAVETSDGKVASGVITRQNATTIVLRDSSGKEWQLPRKHVQEMSRLPTSIMPEGLDRAISREEFADLLAYLLSLK